MAARKPARKKLSEDALKLIDAVKNTISIQKSTNTDRLTHCWLYKGYVVATNDQLIIGSPIEGISFDCCPHSKTLLAALERCDGATVFTMDEQTQTLTVTSGRMRVPVPCIGPTALSDLAPDQPQGPATERLRDALRIVAGMVNDTAQSPIMRAVYMGPNLAQGSGDGCTVIQVWHGIEAMPTLALPKESAVAISKHPVELVSIGTNYGRATFWFADNSFISTVLYDQKAPNFDAVAEYKGTEQPVKPDSVFYDAIRKMQPFTKDSTGASSNIVTFEGGKIWAGEPHIGNAEFEYPEPVLDECAFNSNYLLQIESIATLFNLGYNQSGNQVLYYQGENLRGAISGCKYNKARVKETEQALDRYKGTNVEDF